MSCFHSLKLQKLMTWATSRPFRSNSKSKVISRFNSIATKSYLTTPCATFTLKSKEIKENEGKQKKNILLGRLSRKNCEDVKMFIKFHLELASFDLCDFFTYSIYS